MPQGVVEFVLKTVARVTASRSGRVAPLYHKILDYPVEGDPVVVLPIFILLAHKRVGALRQGYEIGHRYRGAPVFQFYNDIAPGGLYVGKEAIAQIRVFSGFTAVDKGCKGN